MRIDARARSTCPRRRISAHGRDSRINPDHQAAGGSGNGSGSGSVSGGGGKRLATTKSDRIFEVGAHSRDVIRTYFRTCTSGSGISDDRPGTVAADEPESRAPVRFFTRASLTRRSLAAGN